MCGGRRDLLFYSRAGKQQAQHTQSAIQVSSANKRVRADHIHAASTYHHNAHMTKKGIGCLSPAVSHSRPVINMLARVHSSHAMRTISQKCTSFLHISHACQHISTSCLATVRMCGKGSIRYYQNGGMCTRAHSHRLPPKNTRTCRKTHACSGMYGSPALFDKPSPAIAPMQRVR